MNTKLNEYTSCLFLFFACFFTATSLAQTINYNHRSSENHYYWTNNKPYSDYWQQDVHYTIDATIIDSLNIINVPNYQLVYWNNSPDTLTELYFHLYQNAFQPNSYMHNLYLNNHQKIKFGEYEAQGFGTLFENLTVNKQSVKTNLDNTILQVLLNQGLLPNDSITINMSFKTYFDSGTLRRRMKYFEEKGSKHFDGVHWYPSICVYDSKFGWTTEQHLDKEFYADFGTFDVNLTFPNQYIVEATGELTNETEVLPKELRANIDLDNFKSPVDSISTPVIADGSTKTWRYHAINVHNFAFTADPKYRIREQYWNNIKVVTLAMEHNAFKWQGSGNFASDVTKIYSTDFGMYAWPKIVVADAKDGMEYPMLTLDNGSYPGHQGLLAHEMGHMWFYGMIGSNETYRALMDEGFTQFLTVWSLDKINGQKIDYKTYIKADSKKKWMLKHLNPSENRYERLYYPYVKWVLEGYDHSLNTHSSDFNGGIRHGGGYGLVYYKTGVMLYNLRYVLGEEKFLKAMQNYFDTWKMKHPYPEDFRKSIIHFCKTDLNWFFDEWLETTKHIDYAVEHVRAGTNKNEYEVLFKRIGSMQMPIDFTVYTKSGKEIKYHIPNTWYAKETDATVLPKWYGWDLLSPTYVATISIDEEIENIIIDPEHYLADVNLSNNQWRNRYQFQFEHRVKSYPSWYSTENFWRPDIGYNAADGLKIGAHVEGSYFKMLKRYSVSALLNTALLQYDFDKEINKKQLFSFESEFNQNLRNTWTSLESSEKLVYDAGILKSNFGFSKRFKKRDLMATNYSYFSMSHQTIVSPKKGFENYSLLENGLGANKWSNTLEIEFNRIYKYAKGNGKTDVKLRVPGILSDYNYTYLQLQSVNKNQFKKIDVNTKFFTRIGSGNTPVFSSLFLYGANPEELYQNRWTRAQGIYNKQSVQLDKNHGYFHESGGLNLRAYSGLMLDTKDKLYTYAYSNSGASINVELVFKKLSPIKGKMLNYFNFTPYLFGDIGTLLLDKKAYSYKFDQVLYDLGAGIEFMVKFHYLDINPLFIRLEYPIYMKEQNQFTGNKFLIGLGKSF